MRQLDIDFLTILRTFSHEYGPSGVPFTEVISQLHVMGHWPKIRTTKGINLKVYSRAELALQESTDRLLELGHITQPLTTHYKLTESGDALAISLMVGKG